MSHTGLEASARAIFTVPLSSPGSRVLADLGERLKSVPGACRSRG